MKVILKLNGLCCANCAAKIEKAVRDLPEVNNATMDFMSSRLTIHSDNTQEAIKKATSIINKIEPEVQVSEENGHHHHEHGVGSKTIIRIAVGAALFILGIVMPFEALKLPVFLLSYVITGGDVIYRAIKNIIRLSVLDENFLMSLATVGAFLTGNYTEGVAVMLFYQVGELFQSHAVNKSRKSIAQLMDIRPDYANVLCNGEEKKVSPESVRVGDIIIIKPGEKVPLDGKITEGHSSLDTSALTGESVPADVAEGMEILSGSVNLSGVLTVEVTKAYGESTVSKILNLVENAAGRKSVSERFITVFARYYTPVVVILAALLAIIPPIVIDGAGFGDWVYRALTFLVISCPCALVISVPLSFFCGIGRASSHGILVKGSNFLEALAKAETVVFDKTGTLTVGKFEVQEIYSKSMDKTELLRYAAFAECYSNHPIAQSVKTAFGKEIDTSEVSEYEEVAGSGVKAVIDGRVVCAGNERILTSSAGDSLDGTVVYITIDGEYEGRIVISDKIKNDAKEAISKLKKQGIKKTVMLTGDRQEVAKMVAENLGIEGVFSELLPSDKVEKVEELLSQGSKKLIFVGDGINDAPVLARADVGVAMGGIGSDAAIEAADIVLMTDELSKLSDAISISRKTLKIVRQNIIFSLGTKVAVLVLGALGVATMWSAVFADVGVAVIAILNAVRLLKRN